MTEMSGSEILQQICEYVWIILSKIDINPYSVFKKVHNVKLPDCNHNKM